MDKENEVVSPQAAADELVAHEIPVAGAFIPPSIDNVALRRGDTYTYFSPVPPSIRPPSTDATNTEKMPSGPPCVLGVDEAGRGPVLGPMVYGVFYLPAPLSEPLLRSADHRFDDSKALTPAFRTSLMRSLCTADTPLHTGCGWAVSLLSARDIAAGMHGPGLGYNLNAQALDATVALIRGVYERGVNVAEIYVDTVGQPDAYRKKLERFFPAAKITVAKKADSLYPCVSAASVAAKVTRDAALEALWRARSGMGTLGGRRRKKPKARDAGADADGDVDMAAEESGHDAEEADMAWGSGYPSDGRCQTWLRGNMHPVFAWGPECRFSWSTAKDLIDAAAVKVEWPAAADEDEEGAANHRVTDFFASSTSTKGGGEGGAEVDELGSWFGLPAGLEAF